jgi:hypothetical protein
MTRTDCMLASISILLLLCNGYWEKVSPFTILLTDIKPWQCGDSTYEGWRCSQRLFSDLTSLQSSTHGARLAIRISFLLLGSYLE